MIFYKTEPKSNTKPKRGLMFSKTIREPSTTQQNDCSILVTEDIKPTKPN